MRQDRLGESRAAWIGPDAVPRRLFVDREVGRETRLWPGRLVPGILREAGAGGVFADLGRLGEGFVRLGTAQASAHPMGSRCSLVVEAEPQGGKLARLSLAAARRTGLQDVFEGFLESLPGGQKNVSVRLADSAEDIDNLDAAFEHVLPGPRTLPGGGVLTLSQTRAMTVFDIDSHGHTKGGARALNLAAVEEAGRLMALGEVGGLGVIDCVAPVGAADGEILRRAFLDAVRRACRRGVQCLLPSRLGILEVSLARSFAPLVEILTGRPVGQDQVQLSLSSKAIEALALLERGLRQDRGANVILSLPYMIREHLELAAPGWPARLAARYGARFVVENAPDDRIHVRNS